MTAADAGAAFAGISDEDWTSILHPDGGQLPSEASNIGPYPQARRRQIRPARSTRVTAGLNGLNH